MSPYRLAIFDFDGTLADSADWVFGVMNEVAARHGFRQIDAVERERLRGRPNREIVKALGVPFWKLPMIAADMRRLVAANVARIPLFAFAADHLRVLNEAGVTVVIASSNGRENIETILGPAARHVAGYACGASLFGKASKFRALMKRHGCAAHETVAIGDEERDIAAAAAAGIDSIAVTWGFARREALVAAKPTAVVDDDETLMLRILEGARPA